MEKFDDIYRLYFSDVYKYILSLSQNESIAEDITQEIFFKVMKNIKKFNGSCSLFVSLCQIAKNSYFTLYKKEKRLVPLPTENNFLSADNLELSLTNKEVAKELHFLLHQLPEPYKEVITLRVFGELPFSLIGELFDKSDR
ncbi:RNA polymerase sigma factor [Vagococcus sp. BWB3-3]|uniref:RNA polymerase sigma factor n=1 Tax=Vagococcus allomyrinae TaxID=2794353 RepID=A0A940PET9_9ENTE|nr:RNA polymerase sigma factor [Vagococcus allomyrinae]